VYLCVSQILVATQAFSVRRADGARYLIGGFHQQRRLWPLQSQVRASASRASPVDPSSLTPDGAELSLFVVGVVELLTGASLKAVLSSKYIVIICIDI
jgi:hypothetical protein